MASRFRFVFFCLLAWTWSGLLQAEEGLTRLEVEVEGVTREALVYAPPTARQKPVPLVFVFHGHGGNPQYAERTFPLDRLWPEAISVYPLGLKTPGVLTDPQGERSGWQMRPGGESDRDLKFFDVLLARLQGDYQVDPKRVYCTGHSNGGAFTYLLWADRGAAFAAVAPCAAVNISIMRRIMPKPMLQVAGEADPLVKYSWQQRTVEVVREMNGCVAEGREWAPGCTIYDSPTGNPVVLYTHSGAHALPANAAELIVKFFKEHPGK